MEREWKYILSHILPKVPAAWCGGDSLYCGSVTHVGVACHSQVTISTDKVVVKGVDGYLKRRL